ncbi:MAG: hypothetical protein JJE52_00515 [Acidimicrobiia bacterium]|nr:hypothetical protein [Acidimicrobiia bacterium]
MKDRDRLGLSMLFAPLEVLPPTSRLDLGGLVNVNGRPTPVSGADLAVAPVPRGADALDDARSIIVNGLRSGAVDRLGDRRLDQIIPAIAGCPRLIAEQPIPTRLGRILRGQNIATWADVAAAPIGDIRAWAGMGRTTTAALVDAALAAACERIDAEDPRTDVSPRGGADDRGPAADEATWLLAELDAVLGAVGDLRDQVVFEHLVLPLTSHKGPVARAELGDQIGLGGERVRQLRERATRRVAAVVARYPGRVAPVVARVTERLGSVAPMVVADEVLLAEGLPALPDTRSLLVLHLAGPYVPVKAREGWLAAAPDGSGDPVVETRRVLHEDGGVRPLDQVRGDLAAIGISPDHVEAWLAEQPARIVHDLVVSTDGSQTERAVRALDATGGAMSVAALARFHLGGALDAGDDVVENRETGDEAVTDGDAVDSWWGVLARDRRFVRVGPDQFELREWGATPYASDGTAPGDRGLAAEGHWWLRVSIDADALTGADAVVTDDLVAALGIEAGSRRSFSTRYGPLVLANDGAAPSRGSVRPVALAAGASVGGYLLLGFLPDTTDALVRVEMPAPQPSLMSSLTDSLTDSSTPSET